MQIEAGKYYATRDGRKVGPMVEDDYGGKYPWDEGRGTAIWTDEGICYDGEELDIIAEWTDAPSEEPAPLDLAALAAQHRIKITVMIGDAVISYDGRV